MANIIGIGIAALDIINTTDGYPTEDAEVRAVAQRIARGGNVTNTLVVLSQLGHHCQWGGTLGDDIGSQYVLRDLHDYSVDTRHVQMIHDKHTPTSYITLNQHNGSRTIVHYRDLPEYAFENFTEIDLTTADWLHFEGRNIEQVSKMINHARSRIPRLNISVEIEKHRPDIETLFALPDILLFSRHYAVQCGYNSADALFASLPKHTQSAKHTQLHVCTWGEQGAYAYQNGHSVHASAPAGKHIIDTIGAGDTFNAGFIHALLQHCDISTALTQACTLASQKCQQQGFSKLVPGITAT